MKREIHYYYYPGCLVASLVIECEEGEAWQPMKIHEVANLYSPRIKKQGRWKDGAKLLTKEERETLENQAMMHLREWIRWSYNPNHDKNISPEWVDNNTEREMQLLGGEYQII